MAVAAYRATINKTVARIFLFTSLALSGALNSIYLAL